MFLNVFHTECINPFVMRGKSEKQQSPKLNWILGYDQAETFIKLEVDFTRWAKSFRLKVNLQTSKG